MAQSSVPGRMAVAERDALRAAGAVLDAAARSVDRCKHAIDRAKAFAAMRGQRVAKIDAVVLALTERAAPTARSYVSGDAPKPPIGLPELRRAHGDRELAQAFDLARRTVEALEGELSGIGGKGASGARRGRARRAGRRGREVRRGPRSAQAAPADERGRLLEVVSLLRSRGVAILSALQAFFSPPADLRTIGLVVVSAGPWADTLDSPCADPDAPSDVKPEPIRSTAAPLWSTEGGQACREIAAAWSGSEISKPCPGAGSHIAGAQARMARAALRPSAANKELGRNVEAHLSKFQNRG